MVSVMQRGNYFLNCVVAAVATVRIGNGT